MKSHLSSISTAVSIASCGVALASCSGEIGADESVASTSSALTIVSNLQVGPSPCSVNALGESEPRLFVGGNFTTATGSSGNAPHQDYVVASEWGDALMDHVANTTPAGRRSELRALSANGSVDRLAVGGVFTGINGTTAANFAVLDMSNGGTYPVVCGLRAANGDIDAVAYNADASVIYLGGHFTSITGPGGMAQTRHHIAAVNASNCQVTSFNPNANGDVLALKADFSTGTVIAGGKFTFIGGRPRHHLAAVDSSGRCGAPFPPVDVVNALEVGDGRLYAALGGFARKVLAFDLTSHAPQWMSAALPNEAVAVEYYNFRVYVGYGLMPGLATTTGGLRRLESSSGAVDTTFPAPTVNGSVRAIMADATSATLAFGGDFTTVNGANHTCLAVSHDFSP
jgi:hypothetical protein